jgi:hypothetical protein
MFTPAVNTAVELRGVFRVRSLHQFNHFFIVVYHTGSLKVVMLEIFKILDAVQGSSRTSA